MNAEDQVAEPLPLAGKSSSQKKQRTEAQQLAFKAAVEKLKAKRELDCEAKASARAELDLKKIEEKAQVLKTRVKPKPGPMPQVPQVPVATPTSAPTTTISPPPMADFMKQVERMLDERLPKRTEKKRARSPSYSSEEEPAPRRKTVIKHDQPARYYPQVPVAANPSIPPAWYDALFPQRR
jgi:hypothetical protein